MSKINMKQWADAIIAQPERIAIPIMTHPGIELIGKTVREAVTNGDTHFEAIKALAKTYPSAASTVIMDLTVEAEAFGAEVNFFDNEVPSISKPLVTNFETVEQLQVPSLAAGRLPEYLKANKLSAEYITDKPVLSGCIGPFSLAGRLFDMTGIMMAIFIEPDTIKLLLDKCTQFLQIYCEALKKTGVSGVIMAEPAAGLLGNNECLEFSSVYVKKIVDALQDENFSVILHNCGNRGQCTQAMLYTGADGYHFGNAMNMVNALEECPADVLVMGNIDPVSVLKLSSAAEVKQATLNLLHATSAFPNFVLSTGCDLPPDVPHANVEAFFEGLSQFNS